MTELAAILVLIIIGILSGCLTMLINYCLGKPGSKEFSPHEIFSFYTVWLSRRRLKEAGLLYQYNDQYNNNLKRTITKSDRIALDNDFRKIMYEAAEPFFTWERAAGMCPVCFGVWVTIFTGLYFSHNLVDLLTIIVISHVTIRILNKIL